METKQDGRVRPFADFIREHGHGRTHDELSEGMRDLIKKVKDTGRKGSVTLTITVEQEHEGTAQRKAILPCAPSSR